MGEKWNSFISDSVQRLADAILNKIWIVKSFIWITLFLRDRLFKGDIV